MQWFVLDERARETGPMDDDAARGWAHSGRCLGVRSEASKTWTPPAESSFGAAERSAIVADLAPEEAAKLMSNAVASGVFKASIAMIGLGFLLGLLWQLLR